MTTSKTRTLSETKVRVALVALALTAIVVIGITWTAGQIIGNRLETEQAEQQARVWSHNGLNILTGGSFAFKERRVNSKDAGEIFNYLQTTNAYRIALLNVDGKVFWASRAGEISMTDGSAEFQKTTQTLVLQSMNLQVPASKVDRLLLDRPYEGIAPKSLREVTKVYLPILKRGAFVGALVLHYDSTELVTKYRQWSRWTSAILAGVLLILFAAIGAIFYSFAKQRLANEEALSSARDEAVDSREQLQVVNESAIKLNRDLEKTVSDLRTAQDEVIREGKMAQLGQLTATVAHDLRNPLGVVRTAAFLINRKTEDKGLGLEKSLERINKGVARCDNIITELLDFARSKELQLKTCSLDEWLLEQLNEQASRLPKAVAVECHQGLAGLQVEFDDGKLHRALVNLLTNASEAMVGQGSDESDFNTSDPKIVVSTVSAPRGIEIHVTDNGPGIPEDQLTKILEPLHTTKSYGVGLGMPAVEKILEQHNGGLEIRSQVGQGTTVTIWLPHKLAKEVAA